MKIEGVEYGMVIPSEYPSLYRQGDKVYQFHNEPGMRHNLLTNMVSDAILSSIPVSGSVLPWSNTGMYHELSVLKNSITREYRSLEFTFSIALIGHKYQLQFRGVPLRTCSPLTNV
jgi:hypothetical protein